MKKTAAKNDTLWMHDLFEGMAKALLSKIIPALGIAMAMIIISLLLLKGNILHVVPLLFSLLLLFIALMFSVHGQNVRAVYLLLGNFVIGFIIHIAVQKTYANNGGLLLAAILICWFAWFAPRYVSTVIFILTLISVVIIAIFNIQGILTATSTVSPYANIITELFTFAILYISILAPLDLLMKSVHTSHTNEELAQRALTEVKQVRSFTNQALDHSRQFFGWLTPDGILQFSNRTSLDVIGITADAVIGKLFWETPWFSDNTKECAVLQEAFGKAIKGETVTNTLSLSTSDHGVRMIDLSLHPIYDSTNTVSMVIVEGRDFTDEYEAIQQKEKMAQQLHQVEKMDAIGQLAGGVAHDINNLLSGIIGCAELLQDDMVSDQSRKEYSNMILNTSERAGELTKKLLTFSRKTPKTFQTIDISQSINDIVAILRRTIPMNVSILIDNKAQNTYINGDEVLLHNVILNLAINASHAMADGGTLTFELCNTFLDDDYCTYSPFKLTSGEFIQISVRDTGHGMAPEVQSHIFEPFFTTKGPGKGTGLGLSAVYGTILDHHGAVTVYSEVGKGSVFHIYLPLCQQTTVSQKDEIPLQRGSGTILIIDDEEIIRITTSALLTRLGYDVLLAENGAAGIEIYQKYRTAINVVILDMIMPVMGGIATFNTLHKDNPDLPIIIASGYTKNEDNENLHSLGVSAFLLKPFRRRDLATIVAQLINPHSDHKK